MDGFAAPYEKQHAMPWIDQLSFAGNQENFHIISG